MFQYVYLKNFSLKDDYFKKTKILYFKLIIHDLCIVIYIYIYYFILFSIFKTIKIHLPKR